MKPYADLKTFIEEVINGSGDVSEWKSLDGGPDLKFTRQKDDL
jgi:hypothetical protein